MSLGVVVGLPLICLFALSYPTKVAIFGAYLSSRIDHDMRLEVLRVLQRPCRTFSISRHANICGIEDGGCSDVDDQKEIVGHHRKCKEPTPV